MLWLHHIHQLQPQSRRAFEDVVRDRLQPQLVNESGARLAWCASSSRAALRGDEAVTIIGVDDAVALTDLLENSSEGELRATFTAMASLRDSVQSRLFEPLDYDPFGIRAVSDIPDALSSGAGATYMHDFVPPTRGHMADYEDQMRARYMALTEKDLSGVMLRASWRTVSGGGPVPEMFNLSEIGSTEAVRRLICEEIPAEYKAMGTWMWEALAVRDRWTTRLMRSASWSPIQ